MAQELYFEDFHIGQKFQSAGSAKVSAEEIKEFGQKYDPQPFHLDEAAGEGSFFKGLAASGWLTAAIVMRLRVQSLKVFGGMIGAGVEEMRWTEPVRPGDTIRTEIEVVGVRKSTSRQELRHRPHHHPCVQSEQRRRPPLHRQLSGPAPLRSVVDDRRRAGHPQRLGRPHPRLELTSGEQFFAEIHIVVDEPPTPDVFLLRVLREPDGAFTATSDHGESILLADIARVARLPGIEY